MVQVGSFPRPGAPQLRQTAERLSGAVERLQREHDRLIPLVVEGPPQLRPVRMRKLKSIVKLLIAAQGAESTLAGVSVENR